MVEISAGFVRTVRGCPGWFTHEEQRENIVTVIRELVDYRKFLGVRMESEISEAGGVKRHLAVQMKRVEDYILIMSTPPPALSSQFMAVSLPMETDGIRVEFRRRYTLFAHVDCSIGFYLVVRFCDDKATLEQFDLQCMEHDVSDLENRWGSRCIALIMPPNGGDILPYPITKIGKEGHYTSVYITKVILEEDGPEQQARKDFDSILENGFQVILDEITFARLNIPDNSLYSTVLEAAFKLAVSKSPGNYKLFETETTSSYYRIKVRDLTLSPRSFSMMHFVKVIEPSSGTFSAEIPPEHGWLASVPLFVRNAVTDVESNRDARLERFAKVPSLPSSQIGGGRAPVLTGIESRRLYDIFDVLAEEEAALTGSTTSAQELA